MGEKKSRECLFCNNSISYEVDFNTEIHYCECPNCGVYNIEQEAFDDIPNENFFIKNAVKKYLVSGYLRELYEKGLKHELITNKNYQTLFMKSEIPNTIQDKIDKFILILYKRTKYIYQELQFNIVQQPAVAYAKDNQEFDNIIKVLDDNGIISGKTTFGREVRTFYLSLRGIKYAEELLKHSTESKQGFVAMWFAKDMEYIFDDFISKAIQDAGFDPCIIRNVEHNDDICDEIIAQIRKSKFLIADTTGHRNGVYYEAGFAYGLGLPVIWTCREDDLKNAHFDVNHNNFIVWKTGEEFYQKLKNRIMATVV